MNIDERLEALAMHLEVLTHMHEDFEKRTDGRIETLLRLHENSDKKFAGLLRVHEDFEKKMTSYAADVKDAIRRLANIAEAHDGTLDDHEARSKDLEN
jgi:hypothetical protein